MTTFSFRFIIKNEHLKSRCFWKCAWQWPHICHTFECSLLSNQENLCWFYSKNHHNRGLLAMTHAMNWIYRQTYCHLPRLNFAIKFAITPSPVICNASNQKKSESKILTGKNSLLFFHYLFIVYVKPQQISYKNASQFCHFQFFF